MNILKGISLLIVIGFLLSSFVKDYKIPIDIEQSTITWTGKKVIGKHTGNIKLKSGIVTLTDGKLSAGEFVMDMNTIETTDLSGEMKSKLDSHLKSADFFEVDKYPEASFKSTTIEKSMGLGVFLVKGELSIKGQTHPISFTVTQTDSNVSGRITIDRTLYGIQYGSGSFFENLGDRAIDNEFVLDFKAMFVFD